MKHTECEIPNCHCTATYIEGMRETKAAVLKRLGEANLTDEQMEVIMGTDFTKGG